MRESSSDDIFYLQWYNVSPKFKWFYQPHRLIFLSFLVLFLVFVRPSTLLGKLECFWFIASICLATCLQDGPLVRPHPFFWRMVLGFTFILIITFMGMIFVERSTIIAFLSALTPNSAGDIPPDRDYSIGCEIYDRNHPSDPWHNVKTICFDVFVPAHFFGWIAQAIILRNTTLCWIISIMFEFVERSLKHWFPNFAECWWDSVILDVLLCNGIGIWIGMKIVDYLAFVHWDKRLFSDILSGHEKIKRTLSQLTPRSYRKYDWKPLASPKRYFVYIFIIVALVMLEINLFGLKMVLKISTKNPLVVVLLGLHLLIGVPATMDFYLFAINEKESIGAFGSSCIILDIVELMLIIHCGEGYFDAPTPIHIKYSVLSLIAVLTIFPILYFRYNNKSHVE